MAHEIGCPVSRDELFNELGCGGGATLFIDNIDQIDEAGSWATVSDLLTGVARNAGWRAVVTCGVGNDEWKTKLPTELRNAGIEPLHVDAITDDETAVFCEGNPALATILSDTHPARGIARNLFYLSRMIELGVGEEQAAAIATEMDLARLWWRFGGGRGEDDGRFARLKVLRAIANQVITSPARVAFRADDFSSATIAELLRFDSFREEIRGATVAFRHDVLRDWAVGFLLHEDEQILPSLAMDKPLSPGLARGLEIAARLAIESDPSGARWLPLLAVVERDGCHGSWKRPVLLALPRAEQALALFQNLRPVLLEDDGRRLSEIIRLLIAVDSESFAQVIARVQPSITIPSGARDFIAPRGLGWTWLVLWLVAEAKTLPTALIPDISKVFQAWLIATQNQSLPINAAMVGILLEWLTLLEHAMMPRAYHDIEDAPPDLKIPHLNDVRDEIRITAFAFARLNPIAAERYLSALDPDAARHHDMEAILRAPGTLPKAAPAAFVNLALSTLIEKEDPDDFYRTRHRFGPFDIHEHLFLPASPGQGPFLELLEHAPVEGLRLIHGLAEHATQWRRNHYIQAGQPFPRISIPFPGGTKSFEGDWSVYQWARSRTPSMIVASALMALEAWGHRQIEAGRPFEEVLHEVLGPDGSSLAFVSVAVDLTLSHWPEARDTAWPMVATPELLEFDDARLNIDLVGVDRLLTLEQEPSAWPVKRADLDARPSRRNRLSDKIGYYVFHAKPELFEALRAALKEARDQIRQRPDDGEDPIRGLHATAERAVRMTYAEHWPLVKVTLADGSEAEVRQFQRNPEEQRRFDAEAKRVDVDVRHHNVRAKIQLALFDRAKSTPEIVTEGIEWAKAQPAANAEPKPAEDDDQEKFNKEWDQRAVIMAAALAARDYEAPDRNDVLGWARPVLQAATTGEGKEYPGNDQIQYNEAAIGALGFSELYLKDQDNTTRDALLRLSSYQHPAVLKVLGSHFIDFSRLDPRLPRSLIRTAMAGAIRPRRIHSEHHNRANQQAYRRKIEAAIAAEEQWLNGTTMDEAAWPQLPTWLSRPRRGIRLGNWGIEEDDEPNEEPPPDHYVDERILGPLIGYLVPLTIELPLWVVDLAAHLMRWTDRANGPHRENDRERDNRPNTWNAHFFDFLGILSVALPHDDMVAVFLEPITRFKDEAFHEVMATFLRGFDRAMQASDTKRPENPVAVRALLADRIRRSWNFKRLGREKGFTSEVHAGDALNAMFYQPPRFANNGRPSIPDNWVGLDETMPVLIELVTGAPSSGYLAGLFQNLVESSPRAALLSFVVRAATAWCSAYGVDSNFWSEKNIGSHLCAWLERALADRASISVVPAVAHELSKCLDILIRSGIAQAPEIEEQIASRFDTTAGNS